MIISTNNRTKPSKSRDEAGMHFRCATDYYEKVAEATSDDASWESLRLYKTVEHSNDISFARIERHTLAIELSGTARHLSIMDSRTYDAPTCINDVCQLPAGISARFAWETIGDRQQSLILEFDADLFVTHCPEFVSESFLLGHIVPRNYEQKPELSYLVRLLARELSGQDRRGRLFADSVIRLVAIEIAQSAWTRQPQSGSINVILDKRIRVVMDYIESHFANEISLADLTGVSGLNATQLISSFKKQIGTTPYAHVVNRRIQHAVHQLNATEMPIAEIALESGFSDQQQMTHVFRRRMGRTPGSFRDKP
jgi:AraC family transcriptional regulator